MKLIQFMAMLAGIVGKDAVRPSHNRYIEITNKIGKRRLKRVNGRDMNTKTHLHSFGTWSPCKPWASVR